MAQTGPRAIVRAVLGQRKKEGIFTKRELPAGTEAGILTVTAFRAARPLGIEFVYARRSPR